ncbi:excinuclease ABC subunit UvrA [Streptosporangium roseum]|uniref:UvrABC system protein A n=1 Tax=Streptosporangium roseum (strain ATCC 12428 / DSM 43021 / JCM 3005 / KCTC 9067 / NCIMB 10171 / NRRL 2505 / NI 9100) TaxID=479432 RepID=D2ATA6_STRRD|nr:excinuclease ABC subunit UvrA [Streptosporangium roseum]ACZ84782.1 excinuclease ABC, A subunit [Streptosporangium roseum DSM 43021]
MSHRDGTPDGDVITVVGARTHNLRNVSVTFPKNRIVAFTGVSGSGKTSLAIDTVHAEAQLRYLNGVSPFFRQFISPRNRPQVDRISGLGATLAVDQRRLNRNPRSTLGSVTGVDDFLGLLFARMPALGPEAREFPELRGLTSAYFDRYSMEGRCKACGGRGVEVRPAEDRIVTRPDLPLLAGAGTWFDRANSGEFWALPALAERYGADLALPWRELPEEFRRAVLHGTGDGPITYKITTKQRKAGADVTVERSVPLRGAVSEVSRLHDAAGTDAAREHYARFMRRTGCPRCGGTGFGEVGLTVRLAGLAYPEVIRLPVEDLRGWVDTIEPTLTPTQRKVAGDILPGLARRVRLMVELGLGHLQITRSAPSMSGGELQRARITAQLNTDLTGIVFVLDEPGAGLHPADKHPLREILHDLRDAGNTVLLVEHDPELIALADWVVDLGPGAGREGGRLVASAPPWELSRDGRSITGAYLGGRGPRVRRTRRSDPATTPRLGLIGVQAHNVRLDRVDIPLHALTCITGVSGSGKSSLLHEALGASLDAVLRGERPRAVARIEGAGLLDWVTVVDQNPIGRTPRSSPATYTKAFDTIRRLYASTPAARSRGLGAGAFSFNSRGGRCEACAGYGRRQVDMHFMPDMWVGCDVCEGRRFTPELLAVTYRGKAVDEVLDMTVDEAAEFFGERADLAATLRAAQQAGLGYLRLGQSATELSGGEAQRLKLANAIMLGGGSRGRGLVILDEPVTGLHPSDVQRVVDAFDTLLACGNSVVIAEHDLHVAACADWIVDMGPGAGDRGGRIVNEGPPATIAAGPGVTAGYLRPLLAG